MDNNIIIAKKIYNYLEKKINCKNIIDAIDNSKIYKSKNFIKIDKYLVTYDIIDYVDFNKNINDSESENILVSTESNTKSEINNLIYTKNDIEKIYIIFDFITDSNNLGFEYYPIIYGVLDCHNNDKSKVYLFKEYFEDNLLNIFNKIEHQSEWYDIIIQLLIIDHYTVIINDYQYKNLNLSNFLFKVFNKPLYKEYIIQDKKFKIYQKYKIVLWDYTIEKQKYKKSILINYLKNFIEKEKNNFKIIPSLKIIEIIEKLDEDYHNFKDIINIYYT